MMVTVQGQSIAILLLTILAYAVWLLDQSSDDSVVRSCC